MLTDGQLHGAYVIMADAPYGVVGDLAWHPQASVLALACGKEGVRFWDMESQSWVGSFGGHPGSVDAVAFSCDGTTLFTGGSNGLICAWRVEGPLRQASIARS